MASVTAPKAPRVKYEDIVDRLATGDVLLFHGADPKVSVKIERATSSYFSHAAMVIRPHRSKPPLVWQTGPAAIVRDEITHASHGGAQLSLLHDALAYMTNPAYNDTAFVRQLKFKRTPEFETVAMWAISGLDATPFPSLQKMLKNFVAGRRHRAVSDKTFFCSELVAHTLMMMGLLPFSPLPNAYAPGAFGPDRKSPPFLRGASLGPLRQLVPPVTASGA